MGRRAGGGVPFGEPWYLQTASGVSWAAFPVSAAAPRAWPAAMAPARVLPKAEAPTSHASPEAEAPGHVLPREEAVPHASPGAGRTRWPCPSWAASLSLVEAVGAWAAFWAGAAGLVASLA